MKYFKLFKLSTYENRCGFCIFEITIKNIVTYKFLDDFDTNYSIIINNIKTICSGNKHKIDTIKIKKIVP